MQGLPLVTPWKYPQLKRIARQNKVPENHQEPHREKRTSSLLCSKGHLLISGNLGRKRSSKMHTARHAHSERSGWPRDKAHILVQSHRWQLAWAHWHSLRRQGTICACQLWTVQREEKAVRRKTYVKDFFYLLLSLLLNST